MTSTLRTARCGPACRVVWQGSRGIFLGPLCRFPCVGRRGAWLPGADRARAAARGGPGANAQLPRATDMGTVPGGAGAAFDPWLFS